MAVMQSFLYIFICMSHWFLQCRMSDVEIGPNIGRNSSYQSIYYMASDM